MAIGETSEERSDRLDKNEEYSLKKLKEKNIPFIQKGEFHYFVANTWDYWPRTGLIINRKNKKRSRGIFNLIKLYKRDFKK